MQSQKIQSFSFGKICSISDDRFSDYFKHTNEKSIHIIEVYFYLFFFLLYCKSVNLHLQTSFKMFLNVSHISVRYSYQASIVTQRKFGPTTFINIIIMSPLRTKGDIVLVGFFFRFFCFFSAKLVRTITFLSFQIGQLYLVCGCMTIRGLSRTIMTFVGL